MFDRLQSRPVKGGSVQLRLETTPPRVSGGLPVLGHSLQFIRSPAELLLRAQREHGEVAVMEVFGRRMVGFFGPEAHAAIFRASDDELNASDAYKIMTPVFGKDVAYDAEPTRMAEQLHMLVPALKESRMATYSEAVIQEAELAIQDWGEEGEIDLADFARSLTHFTSSRCLLGHEFREEMTDRFASAYRDLVAGVKPIAFLNSRLPLPSFIRRDRARAEMAKMIHEITEARRRQPTASEDFLQTLMDAHYSNGESLNEHEVTGVLLAAMFAGHHTSSAATAWTVLDLLQNPGYLDRVRLEVDSIFNGGRVTHQGIREMTVTGNAIKEALRLHPPIFLLFRVVRKTVFKYKSFSFDPGTWLLISPMVGHRLPEIFQDPDRFDPDRFAPPRVEDRHPYAFIPFGGGQHVCLGSAFAMLQIKTILGLLFSRYELGLAGNRIAPNYRGLVVGPMQPCRVRYRRRRPVAVRTRAEARVRG
jgi:sterol 14-demethylase